MNATAATLGFGGNLPLRILIHVPMRLDETNEHTTSPLYFAQMPHEPVPCVTKLYMYVYGTKVLPTVNILSPISWPLA